MAVPPNTPSKVKQQPGSDQPNQSPLPPPSSSKPPKPSGEGINSCHQCRQKSQGFRISCKNHRNNKACPIKFCKKCLLNRYGENAEEVDLLSDWSCPKCRGICNCSLCMKKKGHKPTGMRVYAAKAIGYSSVSEMLLAEEANDLNSDKDAKDVDSTSEKMSTSSKVPIAVSPRKKGKENSFAGKIDQNLQPKSLSSDDGKNVGKSARKNAGKHGSNDNECGGSKGDGSKPVKISKKSMTDKDKVPNAVFNEEGNIDGKDGVFDAETCKKSHLVEEITLNPEDDVGIKKVSTCKRKKMGKKGGNDNACEGSKGDESKPVKKCIKKSRTDEGKVSNAILNEEEKVNAKNGVVLNVESCKESQNVENITSNAIKKETKKRKKDDNIIKKTEKNSQKDGNLIKREEKSCAKDNACPIKIEKTDLQAEILKDKQIAGTKKGEKMVQKNNSVSLNEKEIHGSGKEGNKQDKPKRNPVFRNLKKNATGTCNIESEANILLPQCVDLTNIAGIDFPAENVGHALQFLEFCMAFGQVLDLKRGQPESVLRELMRGCSRRRGQYSSIVQFHIQLLSFLQKDSGEESLLSSSPCNGDSWLKALGDCISNSQCAFEDLPSNCFDRGGDGYYKLDSSQKLRLLNFLCDETLGTVDMRSWIDEENSKFIEEKKKANEKVFAAREKEKRVKQQMQDEMARATLFKDGVPLSISEYDKLVSKMKIEVESAHTEKLQAMEMVPKKKQRLDAVRTESALVDASGRIFWRLNSYSGEANILVQDVGGLDSAVPEEKWFTYDVEQKNVVENYISLRRKRVRTPRNPDTLEFETSEAITKHVTSVDPSSPIIMDGGDSSPSAKETEKI